jgi:hypothetical protein
VLSKRLQPSQEHLGRARTPTTKESLPLSMKSWSTKRKIPNFDWIRISFRAGDELQWILGDQKWRQLVGDTLYPARKGGTVGNFRCCRHQFERQ